MHRFLFLRLLLSSIPREGENGGAAAPAAAPPAAPPAPAAAPPAATPPAPDNAQPFYMTVADETDRAFVQAKGFGDINALAKSAREADRYISSTDAEIRFPREDAPPDVWKDFHKRIGVPETADAYQFQHPEGVTVDPKFETFGKTLAHDLGLTPKQAQAMNEKWNGFVAERAGEMGQQTEAQVAEQEAALKTAWGDKFDANLADGQKAFKALGLPAEKVNAIEAQIGTPALMELMATIGKKMGGEAAFTPGGSGGGPRDPSSLSPAEAKVALDALSIDKGYQDAAYDRNHPMHKQQVERMLALTAAANRR